MASHDWSLETAVPSGGFEECGYAQNPRSDWLYIFHPTNIVRRYNMRSDTWELRSSPDFNFSTAHSDIRCARVLSHIWVYSYGNSVGATRRLTRYNLMTGEWDYGFTDDPDAGEASFMAAVGTDLWFAGGSTSGLSLRKYDTLTDAWTEGYSDIPINAGWIARSRGASAGVNGRFFCIAGEWRTAASFGETNRVDAFDIASGTWMSVDPVTTARYNSATVMNQQIYTGTGDDENGASAASKQAVWRINPFTLTSCLVSSDGGASASWCSDFSDHPATPEPILNGAAMGHCNAQGTFFIVGGNGWDVGATNDYTQRFEVSHPLRSGWGILTN